MTKFIPRPEHVKVGHRNYSIHWVEEEQWLAHQSEDERGVSLHASQEIRLRLGADDQRLKDEQLREILVHEIMHCCSTSSMQWAGFNYMKSSAKHSMDDVEELFIAGWAPFMFMVMRDNPGVVAYLCDDKEHE